MLSREGWNGMYMLPNKTTRKRTAWEKQTQNREENEEIVRKGRLPTGKKYKEGSARLDPREGRLG